MKSTKSSNWAARIGRVGLLAGACALLLLSAANLAQAQMVILDAAPQDTTRAKQAVNESMNEYLAEKARREAAEARAAEAWRNSAEGQAAQRQLEQYQASQEHERQLKEHEKRMREAQKEAERKAEERRRKELACAREKAANGGKPKLFSDCDGL